jgi:hypothetical protein
MSANLIQLASRSGRNIFNCSGKGLDRRGQGKKHGGARDRHDRYLGYCQGDVSIHGVFLR